MLIGADQVLRHIRRQGQVWLAGDIGTGKTILAHALAYEFLSREWSRWMVANIKSVWADSTLTVLQNQRANTFLDCFALLDEGGSFITSGREAGQFARGLRKIETVICLASVDPPYKHLQKNIIERVFNFQIFGIPLWLYRFERGNVYGKERRRSRMYFWLWRPARYFGLYDTLELPADADEVKAMLGRHIKAVNARSKRERQF